jgi:hypothetical protein
LLSLYADAHIRSGPIASSHEAWHRANTPVATFPV